MRFADNAVLYIPVVFTLNMNPKLHVHLGGNVGLIGVFLAAAAQVVFIPMFGALSDRIGRRIVYGGGAVAAAVLMIPYFWMIDSGNVWRCGLRSRFSAVASMRHSRGASRRFSPSCSRRSSATPEWPARASSVLIAGGAVPLIAAALSAAYSSATPVAIFVICMCLVTIVAVSNT